MITLIRNAQVYSPDPLGVQDILISGGSIEEIAPHIELGYSKANVIDAAGLIAAPGLIDQHVHIIGGGGECGFESRIGPLSPESCINAGITTVVGLMGTDSTTKDIHPLLAYTKELNSIGLNAYCLTGAYSYPSPTLTGSVTKDIVYLEEVIGVKIAMCDHRAPYLTDAEFARLASEARIGGLLAKKAGIVHIHLGREKIGLSQVIHFLEESDFPIANIKPTHAANQLSDAYRFAKMGGSIDFSTGTDLEQTAGLLLKVLDDLDNRLITVSTDANGSIPVWGEAHELIGMGRGQISDLPKLLQILAGRGTPLERILPLVTRNVAEGLRISDRKGVLAPGMDADITLFTKDLGVSAVLSRGKVMMYEGKICLTSFYINDNNN